MNTLPSVKGILFDLDGVLYIGSNAVGGAIEALGESAEPNAVLLLTIGLYH